MCTHTHTHVYIFLNITGSVCIMLLYEWFQGWSNRLVCFSLEEGYISSSHHSLVAWHSLCWVESLWLFLSPPGMPIVAILVQFKIWQSHWWDSIYGASDITKKHSLTENSLIFWPSQSLQQWSLSLGVGVNPMIDCVFLLSLTAILFVFIPLGCV